jgi:hypothetical protein
MVLVLAAECGDARVAVAGAGGRWGTVAMQGVAGCGAAVPAYSSSSGSLLHAARECSGLWGATKGWQGSVAAGSRVARVCLQKKGPSVAAAPAAAKAWQELQQRQGGLTPAGCAAALLSAAPYYD